MDQSDLTEFVRCQLGVQPDQRAHVGFSRVQQNGLVANGSKRTLTTAIGAAVQPHQSGRWCILQHYSGLNVSQRDYLAVGDKGANDCFQIGGMEASVVKTLPSSHSIESSHAKTTFGAASRLSEQGCDTELPRHVRPEDRQVTKRPDREPDVVDSH